MGEPTSVAGILHILNNTYNKMNNLPISFGFIEKMAVAVRSIILTPAMFGTAMSSVSSYLCFCCIICVKCIRKINTNAISMAFHDK